jgi:hypothetical protein
MDEKKYIVHGQFLKRRRLVISPKQMGSSFLDET